MKWLRGNKISWIFNFDKLKLLASAKSQPAGKTEHDEDGDYPNKGKNYIKVDSKGLKPEEDVVL